MAFCNDCGAEIPMNNKFCTECGKPIGESFADGVVNQADPGRNSQLATHQPSITGTAGPMAPSPFQPDAAYQPGNTGAAGAKASSSPARPVDTFPQPVNTATQGVISIGGYVGMMILFGIPVIGWIICIIMANVSKNKNRRNFARATLILIVIMIVLSVVLYFIIGWIWEVILEYAQGYTGEASGGLFSGFGGLFDLFGATE